MSASRILPPLSPRQQKRSASPTIAGYLYQFERSVIEILRLGPSEEARVEGIEDVDLWSKEKPSVVQIKYYAGQQWSLASVRDAVHEMLKACSAGQRLRYILYVHFGSGSPPTGLTLEQLKICLTYKPKDKPQQLLYKDFPEEDLQTFVDLFEIRVGVSLDEQRCETTAEIQRVLGCSKNEAEILHRMRAVQYIQEIAAEKDEANRVVTRDNLIRFLSVRELFYHEWHRTYVDQEQFLATITRKLKSLHFNASATYRGVLVEITDANIDQVGDLACELAKDLVSPIKPRTTSAKPWTLVLRGQFKDIVEVKRRLIAEHVHFNDGYEGIEFSKNLFTEPAVVNSVGKGSRLGKASHAIRVISEGSLHELADDSYQLARLLVLCRPEAWHDSATRAELTTIGGLGPAELASILRRVTT